jgi:asparagine synthase (glutamine-hydrolysing)
MCGIAGFNWRDQRLVEAMLARLRHRGPDDEGTFVDDGVSLGHRRLSILDLSPLGHQPMVYERDGRRAIVTYNGEIFNFREVRADLLARGYRFVSESDTELLLAAYLEWGAQCVTRLNGMWAFALYDPSAQQLLLSRDCFGEKPLHYRLDDGKLIFASEIKAILAHPVPRRADLSIVSEYLYKGRAQGNVDSFFDGVRMLPPAHNAVFDLRSRRLALERYYAPRRGTRRVVPDEFRAALETAVRRRLVSDVPVSISLSSGTDSTSVAALMARLTDSRIKAFTTATNGAGGQDAVGDESTLLTSFLNRYGQFDLAKSSLSEASFGEHYREIIYHMDEPFARQSAYVRWEIAHLTHANRYKVLLNGEGADEVLGGYISFAPRFLSHLIRSGHPLRLAREVLALLGHPERSRIVAAVRENAARHRHEERERAAAVQRKYSIVPAWREDAPVAYADIKDFLDAQVHEYSLPRLLVCNDKMSMANSVEGRAPFLDHEFVDLAFSMDPTHFVVGGSRKFPLREAMGGLVPDEILFRRNKDAFNAPIFEYLKSDALRARVQQIFREPCTAAVFDPTAYLAEYERFCSRRAADRAFLLHGLFLEEWARTFDVAFA